MRVLVVVAVLLLLPGVQSQVHVEDAPDDVEAESAGQAIPPARAYAAADLLDLSLQEDPRELSITWRVADLEEPATIIDTVDYVIQFKLGDTEFQLRVFRVADADGAIHYSSSLSRYHEGRFEESRGNPPLSVAEAAGAITATVARDSLSDTRGRPPLVGDTLQDLHVETTASDLGSFCLSSDCIYTYRAFDRMPDEGPAPPYEFHAGIQQDGSARLVSEEPYRLSNGGAATFVYNVQAQNLAEQASGFRLEARDVPDGWTVSLPVQRLHLDANERVDLPILVTTQSAHQHGGSQSFLLEMPSDGGDSTGRIAIGITYSDTPQPAGHHPKLWLHSGKISGFFIGDVAELALGNGYNKHTYMNTLEDDPADQEVPVPGQGIALAGFESQVEWQVPLRPGLGIGLDFDIRDAGALSVPIHYTYLAQDVVLAGQIVHIAPDGSETLLAEAGPSSPASFGPDAQHTFEVPLKFHEEADFVPHERGSGLELRLVATGTFNGATPFGPGAMPTLEPGGWMQLPLREYRDPVASFYAASKLLVFDAPYLERLVNPGKTVIFETSLRSGTAGAQDIRLELTGTNADWARLLGDETFALERGQRTVAVAVQVPNDAPDGAVADLVLQASSIEDPHRRAVIDLVAIVDDEAEHPDQAHELEGLEKSLRSDKRSPGAHGVLVGVGLLGLALLRRR